MGYEIINQGERVALFSLSGRCQIVDGPTSFFLVFKKMQRLRSFYATPNQYLRVKYSDGKIEHVPGPIQMFEHPIDLQSIEVRDAVTLSGDEILVTYRRKHPSGMKLDEEDNDDTEGTMPEGSDLVQRYLVKGPAIHFPRPDEWIHDFSWHGTDPTVAKEKCHVKPNARKFQKLSIKGDQLYYNITDVRTKDDALIEVKIMIFYEIKDVTLMLDTTNDPIADIVNGGCSDVVCFASSRSYEAFLQSTALLSDLDSYPNLVSRANNIGFSINKVVYRGYHSNAALQQMHDDAIYKRTELRLQSETEEQKQKLLDFQLEREKARLEEKSRLEKEQMMQKNDLRRLERERLEAERKGDIELELESIKTKAEAKTAMLMQMKEMGVDLTAYLTAQYEKPAKVIRFEGQGGADAKLHVHEVENTNREDFPINI